MITSIIIPPAISAEKPTDAGSNRDGAVGGGTVAVVLFITAVLLSVTVPAAIIYNSK